MGDVYMVNGKILSGLPNHAKDIAFDNTDSPLSSTNTEDAIKEVSSNLTKHTTGTAVNLNSYTSSNPYTIPDDGFIRMTSAPGGGWANGMLGTIPMVHTNFNTSGWQQIVTFVRKGMSFYTVSLAGDSGFDYYPLV